MKRVLIPTDFSDNAWTAARYAMQLYQQEPCTFYLLNTYIPEIGTNRFMASSSIESSLTTSAAEHSKANLARLVAKMHKNSLSKQHHIITISSFCLLTDQVIETIAEQEIDMVVLGTKGNSATGDVFMGSNAVRIIKAVEECPVLAIPPHTTYVTPSEITFATDFNRFYTLSELQPLLDLAISFKATIRVAYVQEELQPLTDVQQFNLSMLRKYLGSLAYYIHTISEVQNVSKTLAKFAQALDIHLMAMLQYSHSYVSRITNQHTVKSSTFTTQIPLLIIPELRMGNSISIRQKKMSLSE